MHTPLVDAMLALRECPDSKDIFGVLSYPSPAGRRSGDPRGSSTTSSTPCSDQGCGLRSQSSNAGCSSQWQADIHLDLKVNGEKALVLYNVSIIQYYETQCCSKLAARHYLMPKKGG
ncbi:hypothetical protein VitviT2T_028620 [Vitis vinifera]|uniref:Uncharacterized protein n=1 Tax=Vitis vinifera TaxID=29760 RepID=A0ABY9DU58_VITVI|nr:hypothetical protein VitviT2T_028620 [Vitis vinifera]